MDLSGDLARLGWHLSPEGLAQCVEACREKGWEPTVKNITKVALEYDLRSIGAPALTEDVIRNLQHQVEGPMVVQVQKLKNVAVPSDKQHQFSPSRRLLRLQLTDGHTHCSAIEVEGPVEGLSPLTPPGTKLKLTGKVEVQNGFLLLKKSSITFLGGQVEALLKKWNLQKIVPELDRRREGVSGPPPFISFKNAASGAHDHHGRMTAPQRSKPPTRSTHEDHPLPKKTETEQVSRSKANISERKYHHERSLTNDRRRDPERETRGPQLETKSSTAGTREPGSQGGSVQRGVGRRAEEHDERKSENKKWRNESHLGTSRASPESDAAPSYGRKRRLPREDHHDPPQRQHYSKTPHKKQERREEQYFDSGYEKHPKSEHQLAEWFEQKLKLGGGTASPSESLEQQVEVDWGNESIGSGRGYRQGSGGGRDNGGFRQWSEKQQRTGRGGGGYEEGGGRWGEFGGSYRQESEGQQRRGGYRGRGSGRWGESGWDRQEQPSIGRGRGGYRQEQPSIGRGRGGYRPAAENEELQPKIGRGGGYRERSERDKGRYRQRDDGGYRQRDDGGYRQRDDGGYRQRDDGGYRQRNDGGYRQRDDGGYRQRDDGGYRQRDDGGYRQRDDGGYRQRDDGGYRQRDEGLQGMESSSRAVVHKEERKQLYSPSRPQVVEAWAERGGLAESNSQGGYSWEWVSKGVPHSATKQHNW